MGKEDKQVKQHYYVTHHRNYTHAGLQYDNSYHLVGMDGAGPAEANSKWNWFGLLGTYTQVHMLACTKKLVTSGGMLL